MATRTAMWVHFVHWHVLNTMVIMEEGNFTHARFSWCDILVPRRAMKWRHPGTAQCNKGAEQKRQRLAEVESRESMEQAFEAYGALIKM